MSEADFPAPPKDFDTKLGFQRRDNSSYIQKVRDKQNIEYVGPEGRPFFAKYCNLQEGNRNTIAGLINEKKILDKLENSGVSPSPGEIKLYPSTENPRRARFLMESLPGIPLSQQEINRDSQFAQERADEVVGKSAEAYQIIHGENVVHVDVVPRNLMLEHDQDSGEIGVKIVDFELGVDLDEADQDEMNQALKWYAGKDLGLSIKEVDASPQLLKKAEIHQWARMMAEWLIGPSYKWEDLKIPDAEEMTEIQSEAAENVKEQAIARAKKYYQRQKGSPEEMSLEDHIRWELKGSYRYELAEALLSDTFEERLVEQGIELDNKTVQFLKRALSLDLEKRPENFKKLLEANDDKGVEKAEEAGSEKGVDELSAQWEARGKKRLEEVLNTDLKEIGFSQKEEQQVRVLLQKLEAIAVTSEGAYQAFLEELQSSGIAVVENSWYLKSRQGLSQFLSGRVEKALFASREIIRQQISAMEANGESESKSYVYQELKQAQESKGVIFLSKQVNPKSVWHEGAHALQLLEGFDMDAGNESERIKRELEVSYCLTELVSKGLLPDISLADYRYAGESPLGPGYKLSANDILQEVRNFKKYQAQLQDLGEVGGHNT